MPRVEKTAKEKQDIVDAVCDVMVTQRLSLFKTLEQGKEFPSYSVVKRWLREDQGLSTQIAQAREDALEALIEEMIDVSKDEKLDHNSRRVRIIAIEKAAQMLLPRRFGQKLDITSGGEKLPAPSDGAHARLDRIEALLSLAAARASGRLPSPMIDVTPEPSIDEVMG